MTAGAGHNSHTSHAHSGRSNRISIVCVPVGVSTAMKSGVTRRTGTSVPST